MRKDINRSSKNFLLERQIKKLPMAMERILKINFRFKADEKIENTNL